MAFENLISSIVDEFFKSNENFLYLSLPGKIMSVIPNIAQIKLENVMDLSEEFSPIKPFMKIIQKKTANKR